MDKLNFPIVIDGPNFINRILEMKIDKDLLAKQLSFNGFRTRIKQLLIEQSIDCNLSLLEFVCSKKLFGSGEQRFSQEERNLLLSRLMKEVGVHIDEIDLPGSSEKGVDNMVTSKIETFSRNFESIILISNDRDYVPTLRKMREQGTKIFLISLSKDPPRELINEAYFTIDMHEEYECLFEYNYPKYFINKDFTKEEFRELISNADDRTQNQLRVNKNGLIYISHQSVGSEDILLVQFRFETCGAYNQYVGPKAASIEKFIEDEFEDVKLAWKYRDKVGSYIDIPFLNKDEE